MKLRHRIEYAVVRGGLSLGSLLPWPAISGAGAALGRLCFHVLRIRRRVVLDNLRLALGDERDEAERLRIAGRCYAQFGRSYLEYFAFPGMRRRRVLDRIDVTGREHLDAVVAAGRGGVLLTAHFGSWELLALWVQRQGVPLHLLVGDLSNPAVDRAMNDLRRDLGFPVEHRGMGLRAVMRILRRGHAVGLQGDQEARWHGVVVPFFGLQSRTHPGAAHLSLRTGAPILPCYLLREGRRFRAVFEPPLWPEGDADDAGVLALTARHTEVFEGVIRRHPDHWFWLHKRWKRAPRDGAGRILRAAAPD